MYICGNSNLVCWVCFFSYSLFLFSFFLFICFFSFLISVHITIPLPPKSIKNNTWCSENYLVGNKFVCYITLMVCCIQTHINFFSGTIHYAQIFWNTFCYLRCGGTQNETQFLVIRQCNVIRKECCQPSNKALPFQAKNVTKKDKVLLIINLSTLTITTFPLS